MCGERIAERTIGTFLSEGAAMGRWSLITVCSIALLAGDAADCHPQTKLATLMEVISTPKCYSFDCPPWPMPDDIYACFQVDGTYYVGSHTPWGLPWATAGKRLLGLKGQVVPIVLTQKEIGVAVQNVKIRLKRINGFPIFTVPGCNQS
jgi:hypothetical protein